MMMNMNKDQKIYLMFLLGLLTWVSSPFVVTFIGCLLEYPYQSVFKASLLAVFIPVILVSLASIVYIAVSSFKSLGEE
jgi:hypothetical protein